MAPKSMPRRSRSGSLLLLLAAAAMGGPALAPRAAASAPYELGATDKVRVVVSDWSSTGGEIRVRLTGEFTVDASGLLSIPFLGEIPAGGRTVAAVSEAIAERMQARAGLLNSPVAAVEVVQYRPFYILGFVDKPGEYPYRPGMTVMQALAIAGGAFRVPNAGHLRLERDAVSAAGETVLQRGRIEELLVRRARLQAEMADRELVELPPELADRAGEPDAAHLLRQQNDIIKARRAALAASIAEQHELRKLAEDEGASLRRQVVAQEQRLAVVAREVEELRGLKSRGLTTSSREFTIAAAAAEIDAKMREIQTELLRAGQNVVRADHAVRALRTERQLELLSDMERTKTALEEAANRQRTAEGLLDEAGAAAQTYGAAPVSQERAPSYRLVRRASGRDTETGASELTPVLPGDIIKVVPPPREQPRSGGALAARQSG